MMNSVSVRRLMAACALALAVASCKGRLIPYAVPFQRDFAFTLDTQTGAIQTVTLSKESILGDLDIPSDADIENVAIESIHLYAISGTGNVATQATLSAQYDDVLGAGTPASAIQAGLDVPLGTPFDQPLLNLSATAVTRFRNDLEAMLLNSPSAPASMSTIVSITGSTPPAARVVLSGYVRVKLSAFILQCRELSALGVGPNTQECEVSDDGGN